MPRSGSHARRQPYRDGVIFTLHAVFLVLFRFDFCQSDRGIRSAPYESPSIRIIDRCQSFTCPGED